MMISRASVLCVTFILLCLQCVTYAEEKWSEWEVDYDKNGIKVEVRKNKNTGVLQTRTNAVLNCTTDKLWDILVTDQTFLEVMPDMIESKQVKKPEDDSNMAWYYQRLSRSPISDRDYILKVQWTIEETPLGKKYYRWWTVDDDGTVSPKEDVLRLHVNNGSWRFTPLEGDKTQFEYLNYIELEGNIWKILSNGAAKDNAREFIENLQKVCQ